MLGQVCNATRAQSPWCLAKGKTRENNYYRLGPYAQRVLSSYSMLLVMVVYTPLEEEQGDMKITSYDSYSNTCTTTPLNIKPPGQ